MRAVLINKKLWRAVIQPARAYPEMHSAAQAEMILRVQDQFILAIEEAPNAAQAWNNLRLMHERSGPSRRMIYRQELASLKKDREESLNTYVNRVARIMRGLAATGAPIQNYEAVEAALMGLGPEYNVTRQVIVNSGQTNISLSELLARLQATEDYTDVSEGTKATDDAAAMMAKAKKKFGKYHQESKPKCYVCGKRGHISRDCKHRYRSDSEDEGGHARIALMARAQEETEEPKDEMRIAF